MEVESHEFLLPFEVDAINGLYLNNVYLPKEVLQNILSYVPTKFLLELTLVCKNWCNIIKSENFWMHSYNRRYPNKAKKLPWYIFYCYFTTNNFDNLVQKDNPGDIGHWTMLRNRRDGPIIGHPKIIRNGRGGLRIENLRKRGDALRSDFMLKANESACSFSTSYKDCRKIQKISLQKKRLLKYILKKYMPHIYINEWVAGRVNSGCKYTLDVVAHIEDNKGYSSISLFEETREINKWNGVDFEKVESLIKEYPTNLATLIVEHTGYKTQLLVEGGAVRFLFDSIQPLENDQNE